MSFDSQLNEWIAALDSRALLRVAPTIQSQRPPVVEYNGSPVVQYCSNDYLGLANHPAIAQRMAKTATEIGVGSGASRLISGTTPAHLRLEAALANYVRLPAALYFSSGYAANVGTLSALIAKNDVVFSDQLNHASLIDGIRLSGAKTQIFRHANLQDLEDKLKRYRSSGRAAWVVSDAGFSMDGDLADVKALRQICDAHQAYLVIDEAHVLGILGPEGRGLCAREGVVPEVYIGTLGKSFGCMGAFVAGSPALRKVLENRARSYVFSTAPPPALCEALLASIDLVREADDARERMREHALRLRAELKVQGWRVMDGDLPIVPLIIGDAAKTMALGEALLERGMYIRGIRPPTVPAGTSRLRIVATAAHCDEHIDQLLSALRQLKE